MKEAKGLEVQVRIGKNGLTTGIITEIKEQLKKRKILKVKFLRGYISEKDKKEEAEKLASMVEADIVQQVGFVVVLKK